MRNSVSTKIMQTAVLLLLVAYWDTYSFSAIHKKIRLNTNMQQFHSYSQVNLTPHIIKRIMKKIAPRRKKTLLAEHGQNLLHCHLPQCTTQSSLLPALKAAC